MASYVKIFSTFITSFIFLFFKLCKSAWGWVLSLRHKPSGQWSVYFKTSALSPSSDDSSPLIILWNHTQDRFVFSACKRPYSISASQTTNKLRITKLNLPQACFPLHALQTYDIIHKDTWAEPIDSRGESWPLHWYFCTLFYIVHG